MLSVFVNSVFARSKLVWAESFDEIFLFD